jgi:tetratricopeptide (TPR) repeat protein
MSSPNLPEFDGLWDYDNPEQTETRFRAILLQFLEGDPAFLEPLTQIARAQGLQRKFDHAHQTLDQVLRRLEKLPSRPGIRYLLERGRVFNSSGKPELARPFFEQALAMAKQLNEDFYAVDALHMLAIVAPPEQGLALNLQAIQLAESSRQERARGWLGSLYNNTGWSCHEMGDYLSALEIFRKAEAWRRSRGQARETRIAAWSVARVLRSLGQVEKALARQMALQAEYESARESDGYVLEEIGECLLALDRQQEAIPYFRRAYECLSRDSWLAQQETERLRRLHELGGE